MSLTVLSAVLLAVVPPITVSAPRADPQPVPGFQELMAQRPAGAVEVISNRHHDNPAQLINLGTAYARLGQAERAERLFKAAIHSEGRTDLLLADGRIMDSRAAAKLALAGVERVRLAVR